MREAKISLKRVKELLEQGYTVLVDSPDGYVRVKDYIDTGDKFVVKMTTESNRNLVCTWDHRIETSDGWKTLSEVNEVITESGVERVSHVKEIGLERTCDLEIDHINHRYYAEGISVHNSQGKSIPKLHVDAKRIFTKHQLYVAVSRATDPSQMSLRNFKPNMVGVDPKVDEFYENTEYLEIPENLREQL